MAFRAQRPTIFESRIPTLGVRHYVMRMPFVSEKSPALFTPAISADQQKLFFASGKKSLRIKTVSEVHATDMH
ncbi:MAG: hypothetical protein AAGD43_07945 [Pseudomonadota bacterium]